MNANSPLVYVLILNYHSVEDTLQCIDTLRQVNYPRVRVLVIDNASPENEGTILMQKLSKDEFLQLPNNIGYAGGNNVGFQVAMKEGADYILVLNPDVRLRPDSLSCYIQELETDSTIGALNSIQVLDDGYTIDDKFRRGIFDNHNFPVPDLKTENSQQWEVRTLYGAALMLPVDTIKKVGGFDPLYFAYGEEEDFCRRIKYHGLRLVVTGRAPVRHLRTKENEGAVDDFRLFLRLKGAYLFKLKDPTRAFRQSLKIVARDILEAFLGQRKHDYPFNLYPVNWKHLMKSAVWLLWHIKKTQNHRRLEQIGRAHV
mgnify:CR=1 FL=1